MSTFWPGIARAAGDVGRRVGGEVVLLEFLQDEIVDGTLAPGGIPDRGDGGLFHREKRPVLPADPGVRGRTSLRHETPRIRRAAFHPFGEVGNLLVGQLFPFRGHLQVLIGVIDRGDQEAFVGMARHDVIARAPAVQQRLARIEHEAALHFVGVAAVAFVAIVRQHRPDLVFEELQNAARYLRSYIFEGL